MESGVALRLSSLTGCCSSELIDQAMLAIENLRDDERKVSVLLCR